MPIMAQSLTEAVLQHLAGARSQAQLALPATVSHRPDKLGIALATASQLIPKPTTKKNACRRRHTHLSIMTHNGLALLTNSKGPKYTPPTVYASRIKKYD